MADIRRSNGESGCCYLHGYRPGYSSVWSVPTMNRLRTGYEWTAPLACCSMQLSYNTGSVPVPTALPANNNIMPQIVTPVPTNFQEYPTHVHMARLAQQNLDGSAKTPPRNPLKLLLNSAGSSLAAGSL